MKKWLLCAIALSVLVIGWEGIASAARFNKADINGDDHEIELQLNAKGNVRGIISNVPIHFSSLTALIWESVRAGFGEKSVAVTFDLYKCGNAIHAKIPNTPNNDKKGRWSIVRKCDDKVIFNRLNISNIAITGLTHKITGNTVSYGKYKEQTITIVSPDILHVDFGSNVLSGFRSDIRLKKEDIVYASWQSEKIGWFDNSPLRAKIETDADGNLSATIYKMPFTDAGTLVLKTKDAKFLWIDFTPWKFSDNITLDYDRGLIEYDLCAGGQSKACE